VDHRIRETRLLLVSEIENSSTHLLPDALRSSTMTSYNFDHFPDFDNALGQMPSRSFSGGLYVDPAAAFHMTQQTVIFNEYPAGPGWDSGLPIPSAWGETPTATNPSSINTPLPFSEPGSSDNDLSRQVSSESKRKRGLTSQSPPSKRPKPADGNIHTAENRRTGACLPCQMKTNKHKCTPSSDPSGMCQSCLKKSTALCPVICRKARFQDVKIIRLGPSRDLANTLRWLKEMKTSQDSQKAEWKPVTNLPVKKSRQTSQRYIELRLSQGHSDSTLNLRVQEFDPVESDKTDYTWFNNGIKYVYQCPHYAIADRDHAKEQVRLFIDSNLEKYVDQLLPAPCDPSTAFVRMVFQTALDRAPESSLIKLTIKFWVAGRLIEDPWSIRGDETLGMKLDPLPASPFSTRIPVTPIMDFQIDNIVIYDYLRHMLDDIRKAMKARIMPIKKEDWFDIHLATFILLNHVDLTMKHDVEFASIHTPWKRFSNRPLIEMITFGANSLLNFHQQEKGHFPLSAPNWPDVEKSHSFNESQKTYLLQARRLIQQIEVPRRPGDDLFWASQIYDSRWQPAIVEAK
jgi:hypothetical protein